MVSQGEKKFVGSINSGEACRLAKGRLRPGLNLERGRGAVFCSGCLLREGGKDSGEKQILQRREEGLFNGA